MHMYIISVRFHKQQNEKLLDICFHHIVFAFGWILYQYPLSSAFVWLSCDNIISILPLIRGKIPFVGEKSLLISFFMCISRESPFVLFAMPGH